MEETLVQFVPVIVVGVVIGSLMAGAASKVGRNPVSWFILGLIPIVNLFFIWIGTWSVIIDMHNRLKVIEGTRPPSLG